MTPFNFWLAMTVGAALYQAIRVILGRDFKLGDIIDSSYWTGISMILVHLGAVGNG